MLHDLSLVTPVILAGGEGRRLWPLSTPSKPKPFLKLWRKQSLLQDTVSRTAQMGQPYIICNQAHRALVSAQTPSVEQIIMEPVARNTAPAIAAAAHYLARQPNAKTAIMLVMPSDHKINNPDALSKAVSDSLNAARNGALVTFGVTPQNPAPHYGYIESGTALDEHVYKIKRFVEKPDRAQAKNLIASENCYWNSGIFMFTPHAYLQALEEHAPDIHTHSYNAVAKATRLQNSITLNESAFSACPAISIDYAIMEKTHNAAVIPTKLKWCDLGTWPSLIKALLTG